MIRLMFAATFFYLVSGALWGQSASLTDFDRVYFENELDTVAVVAYDGDVPEEITGNDAANYCLLYYIYPEIKYPAKARETDLETATRVTFDVEASGRVKVVAVDLLSEEVIAKIIGVKPISLIAYPPTCGTIIKDTSMASRVLAMELIRKECRRVIEALPVFEPAKKYGRPVSSRVVLYFNFKLGR